MVLARAAALAFVWRVARALRRAAAAMTRPLTAPNPPSTRPLVDAEGVVAWAVSSWPSGWDSSTTDPFAMGGAFLTAGMAMLSTATGVAILPIGAGVAMLSTAALILGI